MKNDKVKTPGNYSPSEHNASKIVDVEYSAPTVRENHGPVTAIACQAKVVGMLTGEKWEKNDEINRRVYDPETVSPALCTNTGGNHEKKVMVNDLRIRKLTPRECFRLMGVKDEDIDKLTDLSNSTLYHLAGDSIVTTVLMAIFGELLEVEWKEKVNTLHGN